jgi:gluconate 5-dehydrogenase
LKSLPVETSLTPQVDLAALDGLFTVAGLRVFVPGGYGALGEAIAWGFARHGARVAIAGPNRDRAEALGEAIRETGGDVEAFVLDARSTGSIAEATDAVAAHLGGIDVLVNCVGIQREQTLLKVTEETFDEVYETNLKSAMFLAQAVARHQIAAGRAAAAHPPAFVRSQLALRDRGYSAYCATKGGLLMLVKQHAMELARTTSP